MEISLRNRADIKSQYYGSSTAALVEAAVFGNRQIVLLRLECGTDTEVRDKRCQTALHLATSVGDKDIVRLLLMNGADANSTNQSLPPPKY